MNQKNNWCRLAGLLLSLWCSCVAWAEEEVDLSALDNPPPAAVPAPAKGKPGAKRAAGPAKPQPTREGSPSATSESSVVPNSPHGASGVEPHFNVLFDILLASQPGRAEFSFLNFHPLLLAEIVASQDLTFSFEVNPSPRYYELDYQLTPRFQLRVGKIWIPFDDLNPHNTFGGRINASKLRLGDAAYLPDIFTDLGVGFKWKFIDSAKFTADWNFYVLNGFGDGGTDPLGVETSYPSFTDIPVSLADGNRDKAFGTRLGFLISRVLGIGLSFQAGRWSPQSVASARYAMLAADAQLRFPTTEVRLGYSLMPVGLLSGNVFNRSGSYLELGQKFGKNRDWKVLLRTGHVDCDSRIVDSNDLFLVGGTVLYKPGFVQWSFEWQQDLKRVAGKLGYTFAGFRAMLQL